VADKKLKSYKLGLFAESFTIIMMFFKGYILLSHRYTSQFGEIDLIFKSVISRTIIFAEVKARKDASNAEVVTSSQMNRISKSASFFIATNPKYSEFISRFDLIIFNNIISVKHIKNAWVTNAF